MVRGLEQQEQYQSFIQFFPWLNPFMPGGGQSSQLPGEGQSSQAQTDSLQLSHEALSEYDGQAEAPLFAAAGDNPMQGATASGTVTPRKTYYHGSSKETSLVAGLQKARKSGNKHNINVARESLYKYWRSIIDEESGGLDRDGMANELKKLRSEHKKDPDDEFLDYRLHSLANRAKELNDTKSLSLIDKIRHGDLGGSSATGKKLAKFARDNATGVGGECYKYVAQDLDQIGVNVYGMSAYMAADQLAQNSKVREVKGLSSKDLGSLPGGAIVVWANSTDHPDGHISIALGDGKEASDKIRDQITDYGTSFRVFVPSDM